MIVSSHHATRARWVVFIAVVAAAVSGWLLFDYGRDRAGYDSNKVGQELDLLKVHVRDLRSEAAQLRSQNAILAQASEIDRQAYSQVDSTLEELESEILELKQQVRFYSGIVSPSESKGLRVQKFKVKRDAQTLNYRYNLVLTQFVKDQRVVKGSAKISVLGMQGAKQISIPFKKLSRPEKNHLRFRFKYFQEMSGDIALPVGFEPLRLELKAIPEGKRLKAITQTYVWAELVS